MSKCHLKKFLLCQVSFAFILSYIYMSGYGSGSSKVLNTDPIRIRIHNTDSNTDIYLELELQLLGSMALQLSSSKAASRLLTILSFLRLLRLTYRLACAPAGILLAPAAGSPSPSRKLPFTFLLNSSLWKSDRVAGASHFLLFRLRPQANFGSGSQFKHVILFIFRNQNNHAFNKEIKCFYIFYLSFICRKTDNLK